MKKIFQSLLLILIVHVCYAQNWTQPVNVSNIEMSVFPDIAIDGNGVIHVVWREDIENNFRKIFYSKSVDDGNTWSMQFDLSMNSDTACSRPHIVAGNDEKLYVTYDYNVGNPYQTFVHMKIFDGNIWGPTIIVSENLPASHQNVLVKDHEDRIYVFWYRGYKFCYRFLENDVWSEVIYPYENDHFIRNAVVDENNNLYCMGLYSYNGKDTENRVLYFTYNKASSTWSDIEIVNNDNVYVGGDIDIDSDKNPHLIWYKPLTNSWPWIRGTIYSKRQGPYQWINEEIIDEYTGGEIIHISENDVANVFLSKGYDDYGAFKHYFRIYGSWYNTTIDTNLNLTIGGPSIVEQNGKLYLSYYTCHGQSNCDIMFSKSDMVTKIDQDIEEYQKLEVFPNPFSEMAIIRIHISEKELVQIKVYDMIGRLINTLFNSFLQTGDHSFVWDGTNENGIKVNQGNYIIRLEQNRTIENKIVYFMNNN